MKEVKKVSINAIENVMKTEFANESQAQWHGVDIVIRKAIGLQESIEFVHQVVNGCFSDNEGDYMPELKDFAIRACLIEKYTNIRLPESSAKMYDMLYKTDLCSFVCGYISAEQFTSMVDAINDKLDYMANAGIKKLEQIAGAMDTLSKEYEEMFAGITPEEIKAVTDATADGVDEEKIVNALLKAKNGAAAVDSNTAISPDLHVVKQNEDGDV